MSKRLGYAAARKLKGLMESSLMLPNDWDFRLTMPQNYKWVTYPRTPDDLPDVICHYVAECTIPGYEYWTMPHAITYNDLEVFELRDEEERKAMIRGFTSEALVAKAQSLHAPRLLGDANARFQAGVLASAMGWKN